MIDWRQSESWVQQQDKYSIEVSYLKLSQIIIIFSFIPAILFFQNFRYCIRLIDGQSFIEHNNTLYFIAMIAFTISQLVQKSLVMFLTFMHLRVITKNFF